jgi:transcription-repair coupling factor (superfamily II helicase)
MQKIKIVKTLPHLNSLFIDKSKVSIFANSFSNEILDFISQLGVLKQKGIKYQLFLNKLSEINTQTEELVKNKYKDFTTEAPDIKINFENVSVVEKQLQYSIKGDIITIWLVGYSSPLRIEFFGDDCEKIYLIDPLTSKNIKQLEHIYISNVLPIFFEDIKEVQLNNESEFSEEIEQIIFTNKNLEKIEQFYDNVKLVDTEIIFPQLFFGKQELIIKEIERLESQGFKVFLHSRNIRNLDETLQKLSINNLDQEIKLKVENSYIELDKLSLKKLNAGFISNKDKIVYFTDRELLGTVILSNTKPQGDSSDKIRKILRKFEGEIEIDDYVVHEDYGIALYSGLQQEIVDGSTEDYLLLKFAEEDELYVPITQLNKITKYIGPEGIHPKLTKLGKGHWQLLKQKIKKATLLTAKELVEHYAKRELSEAKPVEAVDSNEYLKFCDKFKYEPTKDQTTAINEIIQDLEHAKPMNRLLIGDVGFGKTEVIMRAAFKTVESGAQVAILAPTTVLVAQHLNVFKERFKGFDYNIKALSRFNSKLDNQKIIDEVNKGNINIVIGTHRLLSNDVKFKNLQLLVVDEEQKFGVRQKEKIKKINFGVHVLSVSATPIPRTLSLALSSIQDISIITNPPKGRQPVETSIVYNDWTGITNAIQKEIERGGQVYFVHNRVQSIAGVLEKIKKLMPNIKVEVAHGQMSNETLDRVMTEFYLHKFDILVSTAIIENGLDLPNVNTIIIHDAHQFGLSQLYQLRGRVGRSDRKAHCLLVTSNLKSVNPDEIDHTSLSQRDIKALLETQKKIRESEKLYMTRLNTLVDNQDLGAGFKIASRDLEIRGAGNFLGEAQHGHIASIGYALYIEMLAEEVERLKATEELTRSSDN